MIEVRGNVTCGNPNCCYTFETHLFVEESEFDVRSKIGEPVENYHEIDCPTCEHSFELQTLNTLDGVFLSDGAGNLGEEFSTDFLPDYLFELPKNAYSEYAEARKSLLGLLHSSKVEPKGILLRMIFSQFVVVMEAYLSDRLQQTCSENEKYRGRLVSNSKFLKSLTVSLPHVLNDPLWAQKEYLKVLTSIVFHNFNTVKELYRAAFAISLFPIKANEEALSEAVKLRHNCVHRNGKNKDGELQSFTKKQITELAEQIDILVNHVEKEIFTLLGGI